MTAPRILLIDDHAMFRSGLRMVLNTGMPGTEIFEASSLGGAIDGAPDKVDLVLLDINLNGLNGLEGIALLKRKWPSVAILMLSSQDEPETVRLALARGATGFVSKAETAEKIIASVDLALRGELSELTPSTHDAAQRCLTPRQLEVLDLLHQGLSNKLIARQLDLSDNTVRRHVQAILEFFEVASRAEAVFAARNQRLIG
ncbi:MAG: response regulator transcription factor [Gallionellaceae bacterium]